MAVCAHGVACARTGEPASGTASRAASAPATVSRLITSGVLLSSGPIFLARTQRGDAVTVYDRPFGRYYEDFEVGDFRRKLMVWKKDSAPPRQRPYGGGVWSE